MGTEKSIVLVDGQAPPRFIPSTRFTLALLVFFAFIVQYSQRVNLPIAIVCMANQTKQNDSHLPSDVTARQVLYSTTTPESTTSPVQKGGIFQEKQFVWTELGQQILLGGYWAGYIFTQVPGKLRVYSSENDP
jgi:hypothetical protein